MTLESAVAFVVAFAVVVAIPGPGVMAVVSEGMARGTKSGWFLILGVALGDFTYLTFAMFGLAAVAKVMGDLFFIVKIAAGCYLLYTAYRLWKTSGQFKPTGTSVFSRGSFLGGLLITLANPKAIMFYCIFLPNFIDLATFNLSGYLTIVMLDAAVLTAVLGLYLSMAVATGQWIGQRSARLLQKSASLLMAALGISILTSE